MKQSPRKNSMSRTPKHSCPSELKIRQLTVDDLPIAEKLRSAAGWNQTRADWIRLLAYEPQGCFAALWDRSLVGTVTTTQYGTTLAWIGMMLVNPDYRGRGIGSALMLRALDFLHQAQVECVQLDATPAGKPVYQKLGFLELGTFHRWRREGPLHAEADSMMRPSDRTGFQWLEPNAELDRKAFGADRVDWLRRVAKDSVVVGHSEGFAMRRAGATATYLGPAIAANQTVARQLIESLLEGLSGPAIWDIPCTNPAAESLATSLAFQPERALTRMTLGELRPPPDPLLQYAIADLATG